MTKIDDAKAGDEFGLETNVGKYQPIYYAGAGGDFNPIHIDPEFGKMAGLGGNILQGLCTMSFVARANTDWAEDPGRLKRLKVRFSQPVLPLDKVTVKGKVVERDGNIIRTELEAVKQTGDLVISNAFSEIELD